MTSEPGIKYRAEKDSSQLDVLRPCRHHLSSQDLSLRSEQSWQRESMIRCCLSTEVKQGIRFYPAGKTPHLVSSDGGHKAAQVSRANRSVAFDDLHIGARDGDGLA